MRYVTPIISGSIPACAGEPNSDSNPKQTFWEVYPRVCGGTRADHGSRGAGGGSIPACAGEPADGSGPRRVKTGSIPACAGEPLPEMQAGTYREVYPRVCGGTSRLRLCANKRAGLSPRVRGNLASTPRPACYSGLSPRVRGNRKEPIDRITTLGSIPACAGEPRASLATAFTLDGGLSPRVRGNPVHVQRMSVCSLGLSPRVRGNPAESERQHRPPGSIPACAGEPEVLAVSNRGTVYPRVCGGTSMAFSEDKLPPVYPRVCGGTNRIRVLYCWKVYPRVCGGTAQCESPFWAR